MVIFYGSGDEDDSSSRAAYLGHFAENDEFVALSNVDMLEESLKRSGRRAPVLRARPPGCVQPGGSGAGVGAYIDFLEEFLMNADAFRHFYNYHFAENRKIWDCYVTQLSYEQFIQDVNYSHGSVRDQIIHLMDADETWFCELRGVEPSEPLPPAAFDDRERIRTHWDSIEQGMRAYLDALQDDMLFVKPIEEPEEDRDLIVWQVLLHVINHGTDHRAQLLRVLHDLGIETSYQDYIFYVYEHPIQ